MAGKDDEPRSGPQTIIVSVGGNTIVADWLMYRGKAWIVSGWISSPDGKSRRPRRIISLKEASGHPAPQGHFLLQYFLRNPIPEALWHQGQVPPAMHKLYEILEEPSIEVPAPELLQ